MTNKEQYIQLCENENFVAKLNVFAKPFWLDAVAENWDVCLATDNHSSVVAVLPFCWKGKFITKRIYLPDFNFYQSIIFLQKDLSIEEKNKIAHDLFSQLPKTVKSYFKFQTEYQEIDLTKLHFIKEDYFTYIIPKHQQILNLSNNHKRNIQKGIKQEYAIENCKNMEASFSLLTATFARQQLTPKISFNEFKNIISLANKHQCGKVIDCIGNQNNLLASAFIIEDTQTVYYLFSGYDTHFKNTGAMTFLLHYIIQYALQQKKDFNFCGSSKKSIANYFEGFGAEKTLIPIWKKSVLTS